MYSPLANVRKNRRLMSDKKLLQSNEIITDSKPIHSQHSADINRKTSESESWQIEKASLSLIQKHSAQSMGRHFFF